MNETKGANGEIIEVFTIEVSVVHKVIGGAEELLDRLEKLLRENGAQMRLEGALAAFNADDSKINEYKIFRRDVALQE